MGQAIWNTYNFSSTFCYFVPHYVAQMLGKNYNHDTISLSELDIHNGIEHDASLCRKSPSMIRQTYLVWYSYKKKTGEDTDISPNQSNSHVKLITSLLFSASGKDQQTGEPILTSKDISRFSFDHRIQAQTLNTNFKLGLIHKLFGSTKYVIFFSQSYIYMFKISTISIVLQLFWLHSMDVLTISKFGYLKKDFLMVRRLDSSIMSD